MNTHYNKKPDLMIVDDHVIFRQGLKSILTLHNIAHVIGEASNGIEFLQLLPHLKPNLVLMDIDMPNMNGIDATEKALELMPDLKIIAVTMFNDEEYYYKMIDRGVKGYILKTYGINDVQTAIQNVMSGDTYFSNELLSDIIKNFEILNKKNSLESTKLTPREIEILQHICLGFSTDQIAEKLFLSPRTVKSHKSNLLEKTDCKNTPALILFAKKNKIVEF